MAHIAPTPRCSPLPLFSSLFLPFVYRPDHNFLAQFATATSSLGHQSNRAGLWTQQTVQYTHAHIHAHTQEQGTTIQGRGDDRKSDIRFPLDLPATLRRRSETAPRGITESHTDI